MSDTRTRCPNKHPGTCGQCGLPAGHDGDHTLLVESGTPWFTPVSPVASSATPEVTFTPVRVPHLPQIESSAASSATPTPEHAPNCGWWTEQASCDCTCGLNQRILAQNNYEQYMAWRKRGEEAEVALASSQQEVEGLRAALKEVQEKGFQWSTDFGQAIGFDSAASIRLKQLATVALRALTTEPR